MFVNESTKSMTLLPSFNSKRRVVLFFSYVAGLALIAVSNPVSPVTARGSVGEKNMKKETDLTVTPLTSFFLPNDKTRLAK